MFDSVINYLDKFGPELLVIQFGLLVILSTLFLWLWFSNRRKYQHLKHVIPANVVKNYLDSIIQNSTALKSSLFRGGGMDVNNVPSVMPLNSLVGGEGIGINGAPSTELLEEVNEKKAQIAALEAQLSSLNGSQREIESKYTTTQGTLSSAQTKIKELEELIAKSREEGDGDSALKSELSMISKERDEIRDRLKEFEIIADDLANLKRLQQENEQLKRSLAAQEGIAPAPAPAAKKEEVASAEVPESKADVSDLFEDMTTPSTEEVKGEDDALADFLSTPDEESSEASETSDETSSEEEVVEVSASEESDNNETEENKPKSEKTPEDLLSEFEKMLG